MNWIRKSAEAILSSDRRLSRIPTMHVGCLVLAIVALGFGVNVTGGTISLLAMFFLSVSLVAALGVLFSPTRAFSILPSGWADTLSSVWSLILIGAVSQFVHVTVYPFGNVLDFYRPNPRYVFTAALLFVPLLLVVMLRDVKKGIFRWAFPLLLVIHLMIGCLAIVKLPKSQIDVLRFQEGAVNVLLSGGNPYEIRLLDLYSPEVSHRFYAPGWSANGVLQFGFPYLPLTILLALAGALLGDIRYSNLIAVALSGWLIAYAQEGRLNKIAAVLLLFTPAFPMLVFNARTESYVILMVALVWFCHKRLGWFSPYAVGLLYASKQYMLLVVPLTLLPNPKRWNWRPFAGMTWRAMLTGMIVAFPLALWNVKEYSMRPY